MDPRTPDAVLAYALLRLSFGLSILLHGVSRLLAGHDAFLAYLTSFFAATPIVPQGLLPVAATVLPPAEAVLGALLVVGLVTRFALVAGSLVMAVLVFGANLAQEWVVAGLQLIYCFIYYHLLAHLDLNGYSLDARRRTGSER